MEYAQGTFGRVFLVKFEHGDDLLKEIESLLEAENISLATIALIGALASADIVTGPEKKELPPEPIWNSFDDGREVVGLGTLVRKNGKLTAHIHSAFGKGREVLVGCLRKKSEVFITVEAVVTELTGIDVSKQKDKKVGLELLSFAEKQEK